MREAIELVLRVAFLELRLHRLEANIQPGNHASIALARGAGFKREGFSPQISEDQRALARPRAVGFVSRRLASRPRPFLRPLGDVGCPNSILLGCCFGL